MGVSVPMSGVVVVVVVVEDPPPPQPAKHKDRHAAAMELESRDKIRDRFGSNRVISKGLIKTAQSSVEWRRNRTESAAPSHR